jgi:hypothetical protein
MTVVLQGLRDQAGLLFFSTFYWSLIPMLTSTVLINQVGSKVDHAQSLSLLEAATGQ